LPSWVRQRISHSRKKISKFACIIRTLRRTTQTRVATQSESFAFLLFGQTLTFTRLLIDQCCSSSSLSFVTLLLDVASESAIQASCATPSCSLKQFDNLIGIQRGIVDSETGCTATFRKEANTERYNSFLSFINGCQYNILGETLRGITCESDSECFSGVCNRTNGRCVQGNAELIDVSPTTSTYACYSHPYQCLVSSIDESTARFMFNNWGLKENVTKEVFSQQLVNRYTMSNACVGPTGIDYR
jgi:hypothetical protein